jgi:hypothetical protein
LTNLRAFADHVGVIVVKELPPLADEDLAELTADSPGVALYFAIAPERGLDATPRLSASAPRWRPT